MNTQSKNEIIATVKDITIGILFLFAGVMFGAVLQSYYQIIP